MSYLLYILKVMTNTSENIDYNFDLFGAGITEL